MGKRKNEIKEVDEESDVGRRIYFKIVFATLLSFSWLIFVKCKYCVSGGGSSSSN